MGKRAKVDWQAVRDAARHGVARRAELHELGVGDGTITDRIATGQWERGERGQVRLRVGAPDEDERCDAALRLAGPGSMLSGAVACRRHGLRRLPDDGSVLVLVDHSRRRQDGAAIVLERTRSLPDPVWRDGFPCAPLERAVLDAARRMVRIDPVRALLAEAVQQRLTAVERLSVELEAGSRRGTRLPRLVLGELAAGVRSAPEAWAREIALDMAAEGFPEILWNRAVHLGSSDEHLFTPDGWLDEVAAAWEIQSVEFHLSPEAQDRDHRRRSLMNAHDVVLVEHRPAILRTGRAQVKRDLAAAWERARRRPRPPLVARSAPS